MTEGIRTSDVLRRLQIIEGSRVEPWEEDRPKRATRREREGRNSRILYHVGKTPPIPRPAHTRLARITSRTPDETSNESPEGSWVRPGRSPVTSGVFLSNNPRRVGVNHGVFGHVYAYRVPEHVIHKSGGIRTYDGATELLVPHDQWHHVEFLGKSQDHKKFDEKVRKTPGRVVYRGYTLGREREERERAGEKKEESVRLTRTPLLLETDSCEVGRSICQSRIR